MTARITDLKIVNVRRFTGDIIARLSRVEGQLWERVAEGAGK